MAFPSGFSVQELSGLVDASRQSNDPVAFWNEVAGGTSGTLRNFAIWYAAHLTTYGTAQQEAVRHTNAVQELLALTPYLKVTAREDAERWSSDVQVTAGVGSGV